MGLVYSLKLVSDLLFYMTFAGTISALIGSYGRQMGNSGLLSVLPLMALSAMLLGPLAERGKFKYLAFIPLIPAVFMALNYGIIHLLFLAPALAYIVYYATTLPYNIKTVGYTNIFRMYLYVAIPIAIFFAVNVAFFGAFLSGALGPYIIMFLVSSIVLMRMLRHDNEILMQNRFKIMNSIGVIGVIIMGVVLGSPQGLRLMTAVISFIYFRIFIPFAVAIFALVGIILFPIMSLFNWEEVEMPQDDGGGYVGLPPDFEFYEMQQSIGVIIFQIIVFIGLAVLVFYVLRAIFRFLTQKTFNREGAPANIQRVFLGDKGPARRKEPRVNHQIRQIYRKFLKLCKNRGITLHQSLTTEDIAKSFASSVGDNESAFALREIYIESRYGEKTPDSKDVKQCRELYGKLKKLGRTSQGNIETH